MLPHASFSSAAEIANPWAWAAGASSHADDAGVGEQDLHECSPVSSAPAPKDARLEEAGVRAAEMAKEKASRFAEE